RYGRLAAHDIRTYYDDWQPREATLPCYRSEPLDTAVEFVGHAVLRLHLAASEPDAALHVYLSEEEPDGTVRYVTEGVLRALHRKLSAGPPNYRASWPYHSCDRCDAAPLVPGRAEQIVITFLPTAWRFGKASRIRLAIAGADAEHFEAVRWPDGPVCPHCGATGETATQLGGNSHRAGLYQCNACREPFTVKMGSVMESSHLSYRKWALAFHLMASSKKGMSAHQLHRMLGVTYKTAWFLAHRIREAMRETNPEQLGGEGKFVEADETFTGGKAKNRAYASPPP